MAVKTFSSFEGWAPPGVATGTVSWEEMYGGRWPSESLMDGAFGVTFGGIPVTIDIEEGADHGRWVPTMRVSLTIENVDSAKAVSALRECLGKQCRVTIGPDRGAGTVTVKARADDRALREELAEARAKLEAFSTRVSLAAEAVKEFTVALGSRNDERIEVIRVNEWCTVQL